VLTTHGFAGLTLRAVAAEMQATTGLLTHYFPAKRDLVAYALDLLDRQFAERARSEAAPGLPALRSALLDTLPLTGQATAANRIWVASWDTALADPAWNADHARRYADGRERLSSLIGETQRLGDLPDGDTADLAAALQSFVLGLTVQALIDPAAFPPERQIAMVDEQLAALASLL
jgi:AcrR family transcriptional regulator